MAKNKSTQDKSFLGKIFGFMWRALAILYGLFMLLSLFLVPVTVYFLVAANGPPEVEQDTALVWAPRGDLIEQRQGAAGLELLEEFLAPRDHETVVYDLVKALDKATDDARIQTAFLKLDEMGAANAGQLQDLAAAINRFRKSGKRVVAWSPSYTQAQYYLAAQADEIYLDPLGFVFLEGYGVYHNYFKEALDKLGVTINVFRVGEYKSFVEPFTRNDMSPEARAANRAWLESLWKTYKQNVADARQMQPEDLENYIASFGEKLTGNGGDAAAVARDAGLVNEVVTIEALREKMRARVGEDEEHGSFRQINNSEYLRAVEAESVLPSNDSKIGVVVVEGAIIDGESARGSAGGDTVARLISQVRRDDHAAALLLRVNSPGGSLFASEVIRREVAAMRAAGKPVVVSMAGVAASGGYWIAMDADKILAQPNTITGSIGVFGIVPTVNEPLSKLGIHTDGLGTTELSGALRLDRPLSPEIKTILQSGVNHGYSEFVNRVADARGIAPDAVDRIAQGRVWSGADAARLGLVDQMGGMREAIALTAELAGLQADGYQLQTMRQPSDWSSMFDFFSLKIDAGWLSGLRSLLPSDPAFSWIQTGLNDPRGIYAHCFCETAASDYRP